MTCAYIWLHGSILINICFVYVWYIEAQLCRQFTLDKDGNVIDKISIDNMTLTEKQLFKLSHSLQRMRNLLLCLALLILVLISDSINQYIYFGKLASNPSSINAYAHPSIAQVVVLYLSIWSFVQCILLIYTWIPSKRFRLELKRRKSKKVESDDISSRTIPM
eukprot:120981_1